MDLNKKLTRIESKGEEKKINLRMQKGKAEVLEILAKNYGVTVSTLIREMIDNSLLELQRELVVVEEGLGITITEKDNNKREIRYLSSILELLAPDIEYSGNSNDFKSLDEFDHFLVENSRLSVKYGTAFEANGIAPISEKSYHFKRETINKKDSE